MDQDKDCIGPFITVVSVDGGLRCGNKLTVITPTEINDSQGDNGSRSKVNVNGQNTTSKIPSQFKGKNSSAIPTLVGVDRKVNTPNGNAAKSSPCASFVTVVALSDEQKGECTLTSSKASIKSGIPIKSQKNHLNTKSIVSISNDDTAKPMPTQVEDSQMITMSNKVKGNHARGSSIIEISSNDNDQSCPETLIESGCWQNNENINIPQDIKELVTVYRLPGERLGFGLKFEGGVVSPIEKVRHLYIQSCAAESPSANTTTSWGQLNEGDEIIEIESVPVNTMTRMDCIQTLKDASVAVRLYIKHLYTLEELSLLKAQREIAIRKAKSQMVNRGNGQPKECAIAPATAVKSEQKEVTNNDKEEQYQSQHKHNNDNKKDDDENSNNLNQQVMRVAQEIQSQEVTGGMKCQQKFSKIPLPKSYQNSSPLSDSNNNNINSHGVKNNPQKEYEIDETMNSESLELQPPMDFADELLPEFSHSSISLDGRQSKNGISPNKVIQPVEAQFYLNEINNNSNPNSHSSLSMNTLSFEHCCGESDETGSTRSTVISRLSMASSVTSLSAFMTMPGDSLNGSVTHLNGHHGIVHRRKSSGAASANFYPEGVEPDYLLNLQSQQEILNEQDDHANYNNHTSSSSSSSDTNYVTTVPSSIGVCMEGEDETGIGSANTNTHITPSEIPLEPPLFFQDANLKKDNSAASKGETSKIVLSQNQKQHVAINFTQNLQPVEPDRVSLNFKEEFTSNNDENASQTCNGGQSQSFDNNEMRSGEANWEQKGILDYDDDDELALLAEELGLDQEDEDLFNTMVAEIDGSINKSNEKVDTDELIHENFNRVHFKKEDKIQRDQNCATFHFKKGDETYDIKSTQDNGSKQKEVTYCISAQQKSKESNVFRVHTANEAEELINKDLFDYINIETEDKLNTSNCNNDPSNKNRSFSPFVKVVEPIKRQMSMQKASSEACTISEEASSNSNWDGKKKNGITFKLDQKLTEVIDHPQAPAPPPRTKGILKTKVAAEPDKEVPVEYSKEKRSSLNGITGKSKVAINEKYHDSQRPASASIVRIGDWDTIYSEGYFQAKQVQKPEVRRYNSLTLNCSETSGINRTVEAASKDSRKRDDNGNKDGYHYDDDDSKQSIDDSSHKDGNLVALQTKGQGSTSSDSTLIGAVSDSMDSSTECLRRHHQFAPPTFSKRLPPDGDEFPNSCWSDERHQQSSDKKILFRSELKLNSSSVSSSEELGSPPPLPKTEPPREDFPLFDFKKSGPPPPLHPRTTKVPPVPPPKNMAARRCSFDDRKKLFESQQNSNNSGVMSPSKMIGNNSMNGSFPSTPSSTKVEEPSKKSVKDKIAMFSSRSSSSEDSTDSVVIPKPITNHVSSSLSKSTVNISNGFCDNEVISKSSENLLGGMINSLGRKGSVDLAPSVILPQSSISDFNSKPTPFYGALNGSGVRKVTHTNSYTKAPSLYERSQSMIDVGGSNNLMNGANYQNPENNNQDYTSLRYNTNTINPAPRPVSSLMEQRRKCMTKLRGLIIPDVPGEVVPNNNPGPTSVSVVDLPTIISKDSPLISPVNNTSKPPPSSSINGRKSLSRTESLDRFTSPDETNNLYNNPSNNTSAKINDTDHANDGDWNKFPNVLPKYSPAFKRRGLTAYQSSLNSSTLPNTKSTQGQNTNAISNKYNKSANVTPEPKSLESLTSPRSDSSFEFSSPSPDKRKENIPKPVAERYSYEKPVEKSSLEINQNENKTQVSSKGKFGKSNGKLEDSDNDSAVSSSRSSISHGLSPPNSPTPGDSTAATPDPDRSSREGQDKQEASEDSSENMDESWRILKPQSVEAINRKNVLKSAKFSSGGGEAGENVGGDDSSLSSNGKNRRSDDEEASYADAETEDTESSCSELEVIKSPRRMIVAGRVNLGQRRDSKADTEEDDEEPETLEQSAVHLDFNTLTESPLQAIYDMEMKMAYINEVCDALNDRGRSELSSRYFSRRDSEATVIERPIEPKRKASTDTVDTAGGMDRRARNRSSSGNESDFSSNVSIGSQQNNHKSLSREASNGNSVDSDRWSMLEKKYSKSMTSVNLLVGPKMEAQPQKIIVPATIATSVPKIVTSASEVVEKKIERIIEKTISDGSTKRITNANIPRGRNDFKSIAEKWQLIEKSSDSKPTSGSPLALTKIVSQDKPVLSPLQNSTGSTKSQIISPPPTYTTSSSSRSLSKTNSSELMSDEAPIQRVAPRISSSITKSNMEVMDNDRGWADKRRSDGGTPRCSNNDSSNIPMSSTKRSVSVNDIRKAFEKAEIAVSAYEREEILQTDAKKDVTNGVESLALPAAHFRLINRSFDSTTSEESSAATTPAGLYGSSNSLVSSAPRDPYGSITSLASSTSLISPQELQQLIDEANQSLEEAGTPSHEVSVVILHREFAGGSLGITLAGGADYETKEITVHKVLTASIADRDGRVHRGDRILSINGKNTKGLTHREALNLLKTPRTEVVLVVSRGRSASQFQTIEETSAALDRAVEPLLNGNLVIENDDDTCYKWGPLKTALLVKDGAGLGFSLEGGKGSIQGDKPLTVKKIFIGGPAEKSGDLTVGDLIISIQSINMSTKSRTEAWNFMKKLSDGEVKICVRSPLM